MRRMDGNAKPSREALDLTPSLFAPHPGLISTGASETEFSSQYGFCICPVHVGGTKPP